MMNKTESTESREVTVKELVAAFDGKYVNVSPLDHYGIAIEIHKGTIDEDSIESIEEYGGTYTLNFAFCMTSIEISEYKTVEEIRKQYDKC